MIKHFLILFFLGISNLYSQSKTDAEDIFKMQLFLDKKNIVRSDLNKEVIKNDSLYNLFRNNIYLKIDRLKVKSNILLSNEGNFNFYIIKEINYNPELTGDKLWFLKIDNNQEYKYIIAIDELTGQSYRLSGFNSNDFFSFYNIIKREYLNANFKNLKFSYFLKNYIVDSLDFECLDRALRENSIDKDKFPCLRNSSDRFSMH